MELEKILEKWYECKEKMKLLEERIGKYKGLIEAEMSEGKTSTITGARYRVSKRVLSRDTLSKKDVPEEVWRRYAKRSSFPAFYLSRVEERESNRKIKQTRSTSTI